MFCSLQKMRYPLSVFPQGEAFLVSTMKVDMPDVNACYYSCLDWHAMCRRENGEQSGLRGLSLLDLSRLSLDFRMTAFVLLLLFL